MLRLTEEEAFDVQFKLNGQAVQGRAESRMLLTDFLRNEIGATGTHVGCEHGVCGCCTVRIDGVAQRGCLTLAVMADGRNVETVEGLTPTTGPLNALQQAFRKHHALQCGFCTAGILMSFSEFLKKEPDPSDDQIRDVLGGHICRCTGYSGIIAAVKDAAATLRMANGNEA